MFELETPHVNPDVTLIFADSRIELTIVLKSVCIASFELYLILLRKSKSFVIW